MSILLLGELSQEAYATWHSQLSLQLPQNEQLVLAIQDYDRTAIDIALVANPPRGALAHHPNLRFVQSLWAGVDRLLSDPSLPADITIARLIDPALTQAMVECAIASVFYLHRQIPAYREQQAAGTWRQLPQPATANRPIGVLGLGQLGHAVARTLAGLGFPVMGWSLTARSSADIESYSGTDGLATLLRRAAILINLLPLTAATTGILNEELFARVPTGAALVNLGRGGHLVEEHLLTALARGQLSHAVLDVFSVEPLPASHPFWLHPRITVFPHVAAYTDPRTAARVVAQNIAAFRSQRAVSGLVSPSRGY
jgi:glyoxylate/hydroxypyruvate reductase A